MTRIPSERGISRSPLLTSSDEDKTWSEANIKAMLSAQNNYDALNAK